MAKERIAELSDFFEKAPSIVYFGLFEVTNSYAVMMGVVELHPNELRMLYNNHSKHMPTPTHYSLSEDIYGTSEEKVQPYDKAAYQELIRMYKVS